MTVLPHTFANDTDIEAPEVNANFVALLNAIDSPVTVPRCRVTHDVNLAILTATWTSLGFNTERHDTDTMHDTAVNNTRITATTAGLYAISGQANFANHATGNRALRIYLNGAITIAHEEQASNGAGVNTQVGVYTQYLLSATDYVELQAYQTSTATINVLSTGNYSPEFMACWQSS